MRGAQVRAAFGGRDFVTPDDVKEIAPYIMAHRILVRGGSALRDADAAPKALQGILAAVPVPVEK